MKRRPDYPLKSGFAALLLAAIALHLPPASAYNWQVSKSDASEIGAGDATGFGPTYRTQGMEPAATLSLQARSSAVDSATERLILQILEGKLRDLSDDEVIALQSLLPSGYPRPSELLAKTVDLPGGTGGTRAVGGRSIKVGGRDAIAIWTLTRGLGVCQPIPSGSRRLLTLQLDYWVVKPIGQGQVQLLHLSVLSPGNPLSETGAIDDYVQQASISDSDRLEFKSSDGKIIATADTRGAGGASGAGSAGVTGGPSSNVELKLSLLRRIGTKAIPYFVNTTPGAYNPRLLTDKSWHVGDKQVLIQITSAARDRECATVFAFDAFTAKVTQSLAGSSITPGADLEQKGLIIKEPIIDSGYNRPRFYFFSNSSDKLVEMTSLRPGLAQGELNLIKYKTLLESNPDAKTKLAIACLMLDAEGDLAAQATPLLQELRNSPVLKQDKMLNQSIKKVLQQIDREQKQKH